MREDVGGVGQPVQDRQVLGAAQIDVGAALAEAGVDDDVNRIVLVRGGDVDDVGAPLGEHPRRHGPGKDVRHVDDRDAGQGARPRREGHLVAVADALDLDRDAAFEMAALRTRAPLVEGAHDRAHQLLLGERILEFRRVPACDAARDRAGVGRALQEGEQ